MKKLHEFSFTPRITTQHYSAISRRRPERQTARFLDELVEATGYHRKYAVALLHKTAESLLTTERNRVIRSGDIRMMSKRPSW